MASGSDGVGTDVRPPPGSDFVAAPVAAHQALLVFVVLVQRAPLAHGLEQNSLSSLVTAWSRLFWRAGLGQQLGHIAVEVGLDLAVALRLAAERLGRMDIGVA
jgi:hypothetical protein